MSMRKERYWLRNRELVHGCPNVCHAAIGSENFVARTVQTGPPAPVLLFFAKPTRIPAERHDTRVTLHGYVT